MFCSYATFFDSAEITMADVGVGLQVVQGEEVVDFVEAPVGATQRITQAQKVEIYSYFDGKRAERWTSAQRSDFIRTMISVAFVTAGVLFATLKMSQIKTQWHNFRAELMLRNKCGALYLELSRDLLKDEDFLTTCAFDLCDYVFDVMSQSHKHFQVLPIQLRAFLARIAAEQAKMDARKQTLLDAMTTLSSTDRRLIEGLKSLLKHGFLPFYMREWREVVVMEEGRKLYNGRPDLAVSEIEFIMWLARDAARRNWDSPLYNAFRKCPIIKSLFLDLPADRLYNHTGMAPEVVATFPQYMAETLAGDKRSYANILFTLWELRFYYLYKRRLGLGEKEKWVMDEDDEPDFEGPLSGSSSVAGGIAEITSHRAGAAVWHACQTLAPRRSLLSAHCNLSEEEVQWSASLTAAVVTTFTIRSWTDAEAAGIPTRLQQLQPNKKRFIPSSSLYALLICVEREVFQRYLTSTYMVTALGVNDLIPFLRHRLEGHESYEAIGSLFDEAVATVMPVPDAAWVATMKENFVGRFWEYYFDGSIARDILTYFNHLTNPDVDPVRKMAFRLKVLTDTIDQEVSDKKLKKINVIPK